ncbi:MAG: phage tail sheath family protein [Moorea sp. SIO2B7]|nr:phage tail sheath family protein [Moorena sp. SIO2B7]
MALDYFAPGVYVEEVDRGSRPIEGVSMSVAGFIGFTEDVRGDAELFKPMMITNWSQYLECFGKPGSDGYTDFDAYLPFAVQGWFLNGGGRCWVTSIGTKLPGSTAPPLEETGIKLPTAGKKPSLHFSLKPASDDAGGALALPSAEDGRIAVIIEEGEPKPSPEDTPEDELPLNTGEYFTLSIKRGDEILGRYENLTMKEEPDTEVADNVITALADNELLDVVNISLSGGPLSRRPANGNYEVVPPPYIAPNMNRFSRDLQGQRDDRTGTQGMYEVDEVAMIACPDLMRVYQDGLMDLEQLHGVIEMMISNCENAFPGPAFRMVVLDPPPVKPGKSPNPVPPEQQKPQDVATWLKEFNRRSMYAAVYYPWIKVANPRKAGKPIYVPPSGHMMGIWCRTDESRGIFKAPANETPRGVIGLAYETNMREQELLNPVGINCIRNFASYNRGYKVWGHHTGFLDFVNPLT